MPNRNLRTVPELFAAATDWAKDDGEGDWTAVSALHFAGSKEVLHATLELVKSADHRARARAADILGQLGVPDRSHPEECLHTLISLINTEQHPYVLAAAATALGHLNDERGSASLSQLADNPGWEVRAAVAFALGGRSDPAAIAALIRLTHDSEDAVRDWATFGLGEGGTLDTPEIRDTLFQRLNDTDQTTRQEAICGLARCNDPRVVDPLINALLATPEETELWRPAIRMIQGEEEDYDLTAVELVAKLRAHFYVQKSGI